MTATQTLTQRFQATYLPPGHGHRNSELKDDNTGRIVLTEVDPDTGHVLKYGEAVLGNNLQDSRVIEWLAQNNPAPTQD
jgi:hypothetical protein